MHVMRVMRDTWHPSAAPPAPLLTIRFSVGGTPSHSVPRCNPLRTHPSQHTAHHPSSPAPVPCTPACCWLAPTPGPEAWPAILCIPSRTSSRMVLFHPAAWPCSPGSPTLPAFLTLPAPYFTRSLLYPLLPPLHLFTLLPGPASLCWYRSIKHPPAPVGDSARYRTRS